MEERRTAPSKEAKQQRGANKPRSSKRDPLVRELSQIRGMTTRLKSYCLLVWNEALNQARVEAFYAFRRVESVYYLLAIHASSSTGSKVDTTSKEVDISKDSLAKALLSPDSPSKEAEQPGVVEKETVTTKGVAINATMPLAAPQDLPKEKEFQDGDCLGNSPCAYQGGPQG
ncbi:hypothetical protein SO802_017505 [Lithocarpus litseifolius]|uniref:Uncharacterized protein n=1 Tax=Lithocarpus litseifolius TaxID=425828 RepID=A0AAW2CID5_9ROSI